MEEVTRLFGPAVAAEEAEKKPKFRFIRVLEYTGEEEWILRCLDQRQIVGSNRPLKGQGQIQEISLSLVKEVDDGK